MPVRDIRLGMVGWGYWGPKLMRNLEALPHVKVPIIADLDEQRLQSLRTRRALDTTTQPEDVLCSDVDGVVIATPVSTHYQLAREALKRDKHVLVEKPLTTSVEEAEHLVELARQRGLILMVGHTFVYSPAVNVLKQLLKQDDLGGLYAIEMERTGLGLLRDDVDVIWDLATHDISILLYLLGQRPGISSLQTYAHVRSHLAEVAHLDLSFADGLHTHIHISWLHPCKTRKITLLGKQRSVIYDDTDFMYPIKIYDRKAYMNEDQRIAYHVGTIQIPHVDKTEPLLLECEDFVQAIRTGRSPRANGDVGLEVVRVLAEVQAVRCQQMAAQILQG